mmetsp:Transcript_92208/g.192810  ORF Transcript_92208/g.192810 Transcript_92208/m.192810 type:complete len:266 (-) Transcript_92208:8-805(-)
MFDVPFLRLLELLFEDLDVHSGLLQKVELRFAELLRFVLGIPEFLLELGDLCEGSGELLVAGLLELVVLVGDFLQLVLLRRQLVHLELTLLRSLLLGLQHLHQRAILAVQNPNLLVPLVDLGGGDAALFLRVGELPLQLRVLLLDLLAPLVPSGDGLKCFVALFLQLVQSLIHERVLLLEPLHVVGPKVLMLLRICSCEGSRHAGGASKCTPCSQRGRRCDDHVPRRRGRSGCRHFGLAVRPAIGKAHPKGVRNALAGGRAIPEE